MAELKSETLSHLKYSKKCLKAVEVESYSDKRTSWIRTFGKGKVSGRSGDIVEL